MSELTEDQELLVEAAREFAIEEIRPRVPEFDASDEFPVDLYERMCELGLRDMMLPEEWGGLGESAVSHIAVAEEIAKENLMLALLGTANMIGEILVKVGTEEQKERLLSEYVGGTKMAGFGFTEPCAGSDASGIQTTAVRDGDYWVLNGQKTFISYIGICDAFLVSARTNETGNGGISAFFVEKDTPGLTVGSYFHKLGLRASDCGELFLSDVRVPACNMVGKENKGLHAVFGVLDSARIGTAIGAVGVAQRAYEMALEFVTDRIQFGKPIIANQGIQWYLAEMKTQIEAARALCYTAARKIDAGEPATAAIAMAKLNATEMAIQVTSRAVQLCGGYGVTTDFGIERYYRDAKTTTIIEGTSEVLKIVISRDLMKK